MQFVEDGSDIYHAISIETLYASPIPPTHVLLVPHDLAECAVLYTISTGIYPLFEFDLDPPVKKAVESGCEYKLDAAYTTIMYVRKLHDRDILFQCRHVHEPLQ